jgi:hypothetical protein
MFVDSNKVLMHFLKLMSLLPFSKIVNETGMKMK